MFSIVVMFDDDPKMEQLQFRNLGDREFEGVGLKFVGVLEVW